MSHPRSLYHLKFLSFIHYEAYHQSNMEIRRKRDTKLEKREKRRNIGAGAFVHKLLQTIFFASGLTRF